MDDNKPRVVVCTAHTKNFQALADVTVPTMKAYAERHGYAFAYSNDWDSVVPNDGDRCKVRLYKEMYEQRSHFDVFLWIDTDAIVTNPERDVDSLLSRMGVGDDAHFVWGYDVSGPNSGVYLARFTPQAHAFMHTQFNRSVEMGWGDNTAMIQVSLVPPHRDVIRCVPGRYINAYDYSLYGWEAYNDIGDWATARAVGDDFVLHYPGIDQETRIGHLRSKVKEIYG